MPIAVKTHLILFIAYNNKLFIIFIMSIIELQLIILLIIIIRV